jgi:DNA-binding MarR family transcriptional regulator
VTREIRALMDSSQPSLQATSDAQAMTDVATRLRYVLAAAIRSVLASEILPMAQVDILQRLSTSPHLRVSEVASRSRLAVNTVSTLVNQLEEAGLVARERDPDDRRAVLISLTEEGERRLAQWLAVTEQLMDAAIQTLEPDVQNQLRSSVPALLALTSAIETVYDKTLAEHPGPG